MKHKIRHIYNLNSELLQFRLTFLEIKTKIGLQLISVIFTLNDSVFYDL